MSSLARLWLQLSPLPILALISAYLIYKASISLPPLSESHDPIQFTQLSSIEDVHRIAVTLRLYSAEHFTYVLVLYSSAYLFKQTFCMPGAAALNIVAGSLFGWWGTLLCIVLTSVGISMCYSLSKLFAGPLIRHLFINNRPTSRISILASKVKAQQARGDLAYYVLFLRLFPFTPNWLVNIASPIIGIEFPLFLATGTLGLVPYNLLTSQAGSVLGSLNSFSDIVKPANLVQMAAMAAAALVPIVIRRRMGAPEDEVVKQE